MLEEIIEKASKKDASDIHISTGKIIKVRIDGELENLDEKIIEKEEVSAIIEELGKDPLKLDGEEDLAVTILGRRLRGNIYSCQGENSIAIRMLSDRIPSLLELGLPDVVRKFTEYEKGIVLVTGETGSGKSTTLAAILDEINHTSKRHIITIEDPVEYIYKDDKCLISQREIGDDTKDYNMALKAILREDPDVILIGEMRDAETISAALMAAETGHLVFATLHTNSAPETVDRIIGSFPAERQAQVRMELSQTLKAVISQRLLKKKMGGRIAACEIMISTSAVKNLIRDGKTFQLINAMQSSRREGSQFMEGEIKKLIMDGIIDIPRVGGDKI